MPEAVIWCPTCEVDKATVTRVQADREGVYIHVTDPEGFTDKVCGECGAVLERRGDA